MKFVPEDSIDNTSELFQVMAWHQKHKSLFEPMMTCFTDTYASSVLNELIRTGIGV